MFDVGGGELLLILMAVLLLFGPSKLPELARSFGKGMAHIRRAQTDFQRNLNAISDEIEETVQDVQKEIKSVDDIDKPKSVIHHTLEPIQPPASEAQSTVVEPEATTPMMQIRPPEGSVAQ